jgi:hypothetical protein
MTTAAREWALRTRRPIYFLSFRLKRSQVGQWYVRGCGVRGFSVSRAGGCGFVVCGFVCQCVKRTQ